MTLALYGKSKRRQGGLLFGGFMAVMMAALFAVTIGGGQAVRAADTALLFPDGQGASTSWNNDEDELDDNATCAADADSVNSNNTGNRESVNLDESSIPNGSTITSVAVSACWADDDGTIGNGTFQTFARLAGTSYDSGVDIVANTATHTTTTQVIPIPSVVKTSDAALDLEIGVLKDGTDDSTVYVYWIRAVVTYTAPVDTDGDGVTDANDACPTGSTGTVDSRGCSFAQYLALINIGTANAVLQPDVCQQANFSFIVDRSGSIDATETTSIRNGINGFTAAYAVGGGVGSYQLTTFAGTSGTLRTTPAVAGTYDPLADFTVDVTTFVTGAGSGTTPTQAGIQAGDGLNGADPDQHIAFVITDGSPNRFSGQVNTDTNLPQTWIDSATAAINAANAARTTGFAVNAIWVETTDAMPFDASFGAGSNLAFAKAVMDEIGGGSSSTTNFASIATALLNSVACNDGPVTATKTLTGQNPSTTSDPAQVTWTITVSNPADGVNPKSVQVREVGVTVVSGPTYSSGTGYCDLLGSTLVHPDGSKCLLPAGVSVSWVVRPFPTPVQTCVPQQFNNTAQFNVSDLAVVWTDIVGPQITLNALTSGCGVTIDKSDTTQFSGTAPTLLTWTVTLNNVGPATTAYVYDPFGTLTAENCLNAITVPLASAPFACDLPAGGAGPEATLTFTTAYDQTNLEFCNGVQHQNTAYLVDSANDTDTTGDPSDSGTGTIAARQDARCITVSKVLVSEGIWNINFVNIGPSVSAVNFSDTYEDGPTTTDIVSILDGAVPVLCQSVSADVWGGCDTTVPADGSKTITVNTGQIAGTCQQQTVSNAVIAYFGTGNPQGTQLQTTAGLSLTATYVEPADPVACNRVIQLCKLWLPNGPLNGASTFLFQASDSSEETPATQNLSIPNVTEGNNTPTCILISVSPGMLNVTETVPPGFLTPSWELEFMNGDPITLDNGATASFHTDRCLPNGQTGTLLRELGALMRDVMNLVVQVDTGTPICRLTFRNTDDGVTLNNGAIRIEKYNDLNGNGVLDAGEPPIAGWDMSITGPALNQTDATAIDGSITHPGLTTGDVYTITEETQAGWTVTRATVDGVSQGAVTTVGAAVPNGGFTVVRFLNQAKGSILVHKVAVTSHNGGGDVVAPNDDDGWTITVSSAACNVNLVQQTNANGDALFQGLPLCGDYVITESANNAGSPGFVVVGSASFTGVSPTLNGQTAVTFLNRKTTNDPICTVGCTPTTTTPTPTSTPTTPTATPTTPVVTNTPTTPPASPTTPVTNIAGDRTPGASPTPVAPSTGDGLIDKQGTAFSIVLVVFGFLALASGLSIVAVGRRR